MKNILITTTPFVEGHAVVKYLGVICEQAIKIPNLIQDWFVKIKKYGGGQALDFEHEFLEAKNLAFARAIQKANELGANAIIGLDVDFATLGEGGGIFMVSVSGTAVIVEE